MLDATNNTNATLYVGALQNVSGLTSVNDAGTGLATLRVASGGSLNVNLAANATNSFQGALTLDSVQVPFPGGGALVVNGGNPASTMSIAGQTALHDSSSLTVTGGRLRITAAANSSVGANVTATVGVGATLELVGSVSALADATTSLNRADVSNAGSLVAGDGVHSDLQQVGGIDGGGSVTVRDGASLTANHINQTSLVIGANSTFTLAPSDSSGNPMSAALATLSLSPGPAAQGLASLSPSAISSNNSLLAAGSIAPVSSFALTGDSLLAATNSASSLRRLVLGRVRRERKFDPGAGTVLARVIRHEFALLCWLHSPSLASMSDPIEFPRSSFRLLSPWERPVIARGFSRFVLAMLCVCLCVVGALCSRDDKAKSKGTIGVSVLSLSNPFFKVIGDSITAEAAKHGYDTVVVSGDNDVAKQQNQINDFIVKKVAAIVLNPCDSKSIGPAIQEANEPAFPCSPATSNACRRCQGGHARRHRQL